MRRFIAATVVRPVTTTMVTIAVLLFGLVAFFRLPVDLLPDLSYPTITVQTEDPDAAPTEVEELITRPIEERIGAVPGVIRVESVSREGESEVALDFEWGTQIDEAMADVREKLDRVRLPQTAARPVVLRYDPSQEPIMRLALRSRGAASRTELATLREAADRAVKRELEKLPGVAAVDLHGGEEDEVLVELDPERTAALGVTSEEVAQALRRDNINRPGGALSQRDNRFLIRTLHEAREPAELGEVIIRTEGEAELRLRDIAKVHRTPVDREELGLVDGSEAVELAIFREGDANIVAVSRGVLAALDGLPVAPGHELVVLSNQASFIESAITEVRNNALVGGALAVLVLLFFLRDLRATLLIATAIPVSLLATFIPLKALGVSLNLMSLGGLALGVGMLVDNSIVVLESIARVRESGQFPLRREAAVQGTAEVAPSVIASTLTTVAVFLPMAFVEGVAGQLVRDLSYAVSFSMISSMAVSLTLVPVVQAIGDPHPRPDDETDAPRSVVVGLLTWPLAQLARLIGLLIRVVGILLALVAKPFTALYEALERAYPGVLKGALRVRSVVLLAAVGLCVVSVRLVEGGARTLLPELNRGEFFVQIALPHGASLLRTTVAAQAIDGALADDPEVALRFVRIGNVTQTGSASGSVTGTHLAQFSVVLASDVVDRDTAEQRVFEVMQQANIEPDATLRLGRPALIAFEAPIEVRVFADELDEAAEHARTLLPQLEQVGDLYDVTPDDLSGRPEIRVHFDRERLGRLALSVEDAALAVQRAIQGEVATKLYAPDTQLDVRVQLPRQARATPEDVGAVQIGVSGGVPVRLDAVATVEPGVGPAEIRRIDGRRGLRIRARAGSVDLARVAADVQREIDANPVEGVEAFVAGQAEEMDLSLKSLAWTTAVSIFLVYVVMASSFESLLHPFLIMFTVPLAFAGAAFACAWAGLPLSAMVGIGAIVLGGIVVNNAIVLINAVNDRRGQGASVRDALIGAARVRVRPILMTTLTTILGLVPMALGMGDGAALRQPLAVAIIGGLGLATLLTLVVIPCAYSLLPGRARDAWGQP